MPRPDVERDDAPQKNDSADDTVQKLSLVDLIQAGEVTSSKKPTESKPRDFNFDQIPNPFELNGDKLPQKAVLPQLSLDGKKNSAKLDPQVSRVSAPSDAAPQLPKISLELKSELRNFADQVVTELGNLYDSALSSARNAAENHPAPVMSVDGSTWKKEGSSWSQYDKSGNKLDTYDGKVSHVARDENNNVTLKLKDGGAVVQKADSSTFEFDAANHLKSISYPDGTSRKFQWEGAELSSLSSAKGTFTRSKDKDGKFINEWNKAGDGPWKGEITLDEKLGDLKIANITYKSDSTVETKNSDGSRSIAYPNKDLVKIDTKGRVSEINYAEGTTRIFSWAENPNAKGEDDKYILSGVQVQRDGKAYQHLRVDGDRWKVATLENNRWSDPVAETTTFSFDSKTKTYSNTNYADGMKRSLSPGGLEVARTADGTQLDFQNGVLVQASKGENLREFGSKNGKLVSISDRATDTKWTQGEDGRWKSNHGEVRSGELVVSANGDFEFKDGKKSIVIKMDGAEYNRTTNEKERTQLDVGNNEVHLKAGDGSERTFKIENGDKELVKESNARNGKIESWTRAEKLPNGNYNWINDQDSSKKEERSSVTQHDGNLTIKYPDGRVFKSQTSGAERLENSKDGWSMDFLNGRPSELKYADGYVRKFTFDGPTNGPKTLEVKSNDGTTTKYERISEGVYKYSSEGKEKTWNATVTVSREGVYKYEEQDEKGNASKATTRTIDGISIIDNFVDKTRVEKLNDDIRKVTADGKAVEIVRDSKKNVVELRDFASNTSYVKDQSGAYSASALDASKPFANLDKLVRQGEPHLEESGLVNFTDKKGTQVRQAPGAKGELVSSEDKTVKAVLQNDALQDAEKDRLKNNISALLNRADLEPRHKAIFLEHLEKIGTERTDISNKEKAELYAHLNRLLESKSDKVFNGKDRSLLAAQLVWHVANPTLNQQGANPNCQVTTIRGKMLYEQPAHFARMMSDVITTGEFVSADKSVVKVPKSSMQIPKKCEEAKFPPEDGARTWLGKISDLTCANIHWQRQTKSPTGELVRAGQLVYRQDPPEAMKDTGARIFKDPGDGLLYPQNGKDGKLLKQPSLYSADIAGVYNQICGAKGTVILGANRAEITTGPGVSVVSGEEQLHKQLQEGGVKIAQIWTGSDWVYKEPVRKFGVRTAEDDSGEHVVLVKDYDPKTRTLCVDNSWSVKYDRLSSDRRITLQELYKAMAKK